MVPGNNATWVQSDQNICLLSAVTLFQLELVNLYQNGDLIRLWEAASQTDLTFNLVSHSLVSCPRRPSFHLRFIPHSKLADGRNPSLGRLQVEGGVIFSLV